MESKTRKVNMTESAQAEAFLADLPITVKRMIRARRRKKAAVPVAAAACAAEVLLVAYAAFHLSVMNLFMVLALAVGGAGIAFYLVSNWQCGCRENEVVQILVSSGLSMPEIYQKAAELKIGRERIDMLLFDERQQF